MNLLEEYLRYLSEEEEEEKKKSSWKDYAKKYGKYAIAAGVGLASGMVASRANARIRKLERGKQDKKQVPEYIPRRKRQYYI